MITKPQRRIWIILDAAMRAKELMPTLRELQELCGYKTPSAVKYQLKALQRIGVVSVDTRIARGISLVEPYNWFDGS